MHAPGRDIIVNPNIINITDKEYSGGNKNWDISQDSQGVVYIANNDGLLEYDGVRWALYRDASCRLIRSVAVDAHDRVFTGGFEEFGFWDRDARGTLRYHLLSDMIPPGVFVNEDIWRIKIVPDGVYFQSFARIYYYDYQTVRVIEPGGFILFMNPVGDRFLMHSKGRILELMDNRLEEVVATDFNGGTLSTIRVILPYGEDGTVLLGTATQGLYLLRNGTLSRWGSEIDRIVPDYDLNCAIRMDNGDYVFGTILNGIYRTDSSGRIINHFNTSNYLQNNTVLSLFADSSGNIWAGLDKGIARLNYSSDFNFFLDYGGRIGSVYTTALHNGLLYIGSNRGLFYIPWDEFASHDPLSKVRMVQGSQGQVWNLKVADGQLLCAHNHGMLAVTGGTGRFLFSGNGVFDMEPVSRGGRDMVLASSYSLPMLFDKDGSGNYRYSNNLSGFSAPAQFIQIDHMDNIWIAHMTRNVYKCRADEKLTSVTAVSEYGREKFGTQGVNIKMGRMGGRIVFVADDSFFLYNDISDSIIPYDRMNALNIKTHEINRLVEMDRNYYWLVGKNSATLLRYISPQIDIVKQYDLGNLGVSTVDGFENVVKLNDTLSLLCLDNGFLIHNIRNVRESEKPFRPVMLKSIYIYDSDGNSDTLELTSKKAAWIAYRKNNLNFRFSYPDLSGQKITFRYRIDEITSNWSDIPGNADLKLERLPAGTYTLRVKAVNYFDEDSPEFAYGFRIMPPWYSSWIAIAGYVLIAIGIFLALWISERIRLRKRHIRRLQMMEKQYLVRQNEELRNEVKERETELFDVTNTMISKNKVLSKIKDQFDTYKENTPPQRFPDKLYDKINELIDNDVETNNDWKLFMVHFEQNYKGFFNNVKARFPSLTSGDLKLCACLRMNLSTKDIASLLCISIRGVEIGRYRLRKKMGIDSSVNLNDFFIKNF